MTEQIPTANSLIRYETDAHAVRHRKSSHVNPNKAGRWALWFGCLVSGVWFGLLGMVALATPILDNFKADIYIFSALIVALSMPGILMFFAGLFAQAQSQSAAANTLVLEAANQLLLPSAAASDAARTHAQSLRTEAESVERAMTQAVAVLQSFTGELEARRNSLFEATGTSVEKTELLIHQLGGERLALAELTETINIQLAQIGQSVPKQARVLAETLKAAGDEVRTAEDSLESRLSAFDTAEAKLVARMQDVDALAQSTAAYTERLEVLVGQIETRLNDTTKLIDASVKAGDLASTAAHATGLSLQNAVSDALDGARIASDEIAARTIETAKQAASAIKDLRKAGGETQNIYDQIAQQAEQDAKKIQRQAELERLKNEGDIPDWVEPAAKFDAQLSNANDPSSRPFQNFQPRQEGVAPSKSIQPQMPTDFDALEDAFLEDVVESRPAPHADAHPINGVESGFIITDLDSPADAPIRLSRLSEDVHYDAQTAPENAFPQPEPAPNFAEERRKETRKTNATEPTPVGKNTSGKSGKSGSWGDILAGADRAATQERPPREKTAETLVIALEREGIDLHKIFKPKDKKRIAVAARRGDYARRTAVKDAARNFVGAIENILNTQPDLKDAAKVFLDYENSEALQALEKTHKTNKNAGVRLAVYLLLDAAVGKARAA